MSVDTPKGNTNSEAEGLFSKKEKSVMRDTNQVRPTEEEIRRRAYEIYEARGRQDGKEFDDWVTAEKELAEHSISVT